MLYIPQTEYGFNLAFIVSGRRKAVKALYKACKRVDDISPHGTAKYGLNAAKSPSEDFLKPTVARITVVIVLSAGGQLSCRAYLTADSGQSGCEW